MWKKDEPTTAPQARTGAAPRSESHRSTGNDDSGERATIGPSITIKGEVSGDEDLLIQGHVEGSVELDLHAVTVGRDGQVKANITARVVTVEGNVEGDLLAQEQIILRTSARVIGDITAPRVVLEDGASFKGLVDMGEPADKRTANTKPKAATSSSRSDTSNGKSESDSSSSAARASSGKDTEDSELVNKATT